MRDEVEVTTSYVIRGGEEGRARLRVLARALLPTTERLLLDAGIGPGKTCLDVGCGGGDVSVAMARLVGSSGSVTGIDRDETKLTLARDETAALANVEFRSLDVEQLELDAEFDLVYARFLLTHLRDPLAALRRLARAAKPGGVVVVEDIDHSGVFSYPASAAIERHVGLYNELVRSKGADPEIGPKLPGLFRQAGFAQPNVSHVQPVFIAGDAKRIHQITLANIAPAITASGLATEAEIETLTRDLDDFVESAETIVSLPRIYQVWARRP